MKNSFLINPVFTKIEFWAVTTIFALIMFFFITDGFDQGNAMYESRFHTAGLEYDFYKNFFLPQLIRNISLFLMALYLNFVVVPKLLGRQKFWMHLVMLALVFAGLGTVFGISDYYLRTFSYISHPAPKELMFSQGLDSAFVVFAVFAIYTVIKYSSILLLSVSGKIESKFTFFRREGIVASFISSVVLLFMVVLDAPGLATAVWIMTIPTSILLYLFGFYTLIPISLTKKHSFIFYAFLNFIILFVVLMAWGMILKHVVGGVIGGDKAPLAALWIFNSVLQMFITVPATWLLYKREMKGNEQLNVLKKQLRQSNASFDFLRSQINPHFLFNALNTIYGTAIQEKAERTSEGIQKLGDMMRFMLQENMQRQIPLKRDIEYLENYIDLQKLRTTNDPGIRITTKIDDNKNNYQIAPMLLIPFVENAFKHGISLREPSEIKIELKITAGTLDFRVFNSKHTRPGPDLETGKSGIGLDNVKQRLNLLYPERHELIIRDGEKDFSIHLILELSKFE